jgi:uncharacterized membrane protein YbhN (UPF0104 family)
MTRILKSKSVIITLKVLISTSLFYFLVSKIGIKTIIETIRLLDLSSFIIAMSIYIASILLSSLRWRLFLSHKLPIKKLFSLYMIGSFFNTYMPGIVGGDAVKVYYLNKEIKENFPKEKNYDSFLSESVASVFIDRYIGFFTLLCICLFAFLFGSKYLKDTSINWIIPLIFILFIVSSLIIFRFRIGERLVFLSNFYNHFQKYIERKDTLIKAFFYSIIIQISGIFTVFVLSKGMSVGVPFNFLLLFIPIIILISFLPISLSGIGLREGAFVIFFQTIGIPPHQSMTLSILWFLSTVTASLWGLVEYLRYKQKNNA